MLTAGTRRRERTTVLALALGLALAAWAVGAGCGGTIPESRYYVLEYAGGGEGAGGADAASGGAAGRLEVVIGVDAFSARPLYRDRRIAYRITDHELAYYPYRFWAADPGELVASQLADHLRRRKVAMAVLEQPFDLVPDWIVAGRLQRFEEVDRGDGWFAVLEIAILIEESGRRSVLAERVVHREVPTTLRTPEAVARAMSIAVGEVGGEIETMLREVVAEERP